MRRFLTCITVLLTSIYCVFAQQEEYTTSTTVLGVTDKLLSVESVGISAKKKDVLDNAIKSAFHTLFYYGVEGYNDNKPILAKDNTYFKDKFFDKRYPMFVASSELITKPEKLSDGRYTAKVKVDIYIASLMRDLVIEGLAPKQASQTTFKDTDEAIALPTIMVVPYKSDDQTYSSLLKNDSDLRTAVAKVQEGFVKQGVTTIDFEAKLEAAYRAKEFGMGSTASSAEKNIISQAGSDVYVVVDLEKDRDTALGNRIRLNMKAYDTKSGGILSTCAKGWTNYIHNADAEDLCIVAVNAQIKEFLRDLSTSFANQGEKGKTVVVRISKGVNSPIGLTSQVAGGSPLNSVIRRWIRSHAAQGRYHVQGMVDEEMIFDYVQIPPIDSDGLPLDAMTFGDNLLYYLNNEVGVPCALKVDGTSIVITTK